MEKKHFSLTFVGFLLGDSVGDFVGFFVGCFDGAWSSSNTSFKAQKYYELKIKTDGKETFLIYLCWIFAGRLGWGFSRILGWLLRWSLVEIANKFEVENWW
jgi:hypothetical protein